jgi:glutamine amidotransferase
VEETIGVCSYGVDFSAAVQKKNVFACQFHPERSGEVGLRALANFVKEAKR